MVANVADNAKLFLELIEDEVNPLCTLTPILVSIPPRDAYSRVEGLFKMGSPNYISTVSGLSTRVFAHDAYFAFVSVMKSFVQHQKMRCFAHSAGWCTGKF